MVWVFCGFLHMFLSSGKCGIQNNPIVPSGRTERAGIKGSTAAAGSAGKGPRAVDEKASTINQITFQKGIRLWIE